MLFRSALSEVTVRRASDFGVNDTEYTVRTHLGNLLNAGDSVMGYHLSGTNFNNPEFEAVEESKQYSSTIPDVVLVKKVYPARRKNKGRSWKLKRMAREESEMAPRKQDMDRDAMDYEMFLQDVEQDEELRAGLNLYKAQRQAEEERRRQANEQSQGGMEIGRAHV